MSIKPNASTLILFSSRYIVVDSDMGKRLVMKYSARHLYRIFTDNCTQALFLLNGCLTQDEFVLIFNWETRSLVFANKRIRKFFRRIGLHNPDGLPALSIAWCVARGVYSKPQEAANFYLQQEEIQRGLEKDEEKNVIETCHAYRYENVFYKVSMGFYRLGVFRKLVNLRILVKEIEREEFESLLAEGKQFVPTPLRVAA